MAARNSPSGRRARLHCAMAPCPPRTVFMLAPLWINTLFSNHCDTLLHTASAGGEINSCARFFRRTVLLMQTYREIIDPVKTEATYDNCDTHAALRFAMYPAIRPHISRGSMQRWLLCEVHSVSVHGILVLLAITINCPTAAYHPQCLVEVASTPHLPAHKEPLPGPSSVPCL